MLGVLVVETVLSACLFLAGELSLGSLLFGCGGGQGEGVACVDVQGVFRTVLLYVGQCYGLAVPWVGRTLAVEQGIDVVHLLSGGLLAQGLYGVGQFCLCAIGEFGICHYGREVCLQECTAVHIGLIGVCPLGDVLHL